MPVIYCGASSITDISDVSHSNASALYDNDWLTCDSICGSCEANFDPTAPGTITSIKAVVIHGSTWPEGYWRQSQDDPPGPDEWIGNSARIYFGCSAGTIDMFDSMDYPGYTNYNGADPDYDSNPTFKVALPPAWFSATYMHIHLSMGGEAWDILEALLEVTYTANHGYTTDHVVPTTSTPRRIVATNMWDNNTGVFNIPSTSSPARFLMDYQEVGGGMQQILGFPYLTSYH